ncbi:MAG: BlaI/MecI/CopY family transcriptional regulator [Candidatus Latescibacterota bacterium]
MARRPSRTLTEVELEFMQFLWERGELASEDIEAAYAERGSPLTGGSVRKVLGILMRKGYVSRRKEGKKFIYAAKVPREQASTGVVKDLLQRVFGGSASLLVAALLDSREVHEKELKEIERLIAERRKETENGHR